MRLERLIWGFIFSSISGLATAAGFRALGYNVCFWIYFRNPDVLNDTENYQSYLSAFNHLTTLTKFVLPAWVIVWLIFELRFQRRGFTGRSRILTHLLFGPLVIPVLMFAIVLCCDLGLIQYSRWQIYRYIHSNASPFNDPSFDLYNNYRGSCGDAAIGHIAGLYGDIPVSEFSSQDPGVRARSLKAEIQVTNWWNGDDESFTTMVDKAIHDPDPTVRKIAENLYAENPGLQH